MALIYHKAGPEDLDALMATRMDFIRDVGQLPPEAELGDIVRNTRDFYETGLRQGTHVAYLVLDGDRVVGSGDISYYQVLPTYRTPTGEKGYILNIYTHPDYRGRGIATHTVDLLIRDAKARGVTTVSLEASAMGRPVYLRYGFAPMANELEYPPAP